MSSTSPRKADATAVDRVPFVDQRFVDRVLALEGRPARDDLDAPLRGGSLLSARHALRIFESQLQSRHLDLCARRLKAKGEGFYTIGSSGHEGNACVAAALRPTDPALLHYRSCAFFLQRARQADYADAPLDVLLGVCASRDEPISGGRHKVFGSVPLAIPPQTSTIGSHLPKAMGMAFAIERAKRLQLPLDLPYDAIVTCTFGDASLNHSTAQGALNAAAWAAYQGSRMPVLFVCEDNGLGISVPTPPQWVRDSMSERPGIEFFEADGLDLLDAFAAATEAAEFVRRERKPAFLQLRVVRLMGHAGSDVETMYRSVEQIEAMEERDPVIATAQLLIEEGVVTPERVVAMYEEARVRIDALGEEASSRPKLTGRDEILAPLAPLDHAAIAKEIVRPRDVHARRAFWSDKLPEDERPGPLVQHLNRALGDLLIRYPELLLFGEDVGHKGGVYGVTRGLARRTQRGRVFDTLLDEQTILGTAIGAAQLGFLPIPEIQYLAYLHNAEDQLRGEAASMQFFSNGQFKNPMVVRIASYAYQKGFGGHFHNDHSVAVLRDMPGLVIASPSRGDDAAAMLHTCIAAAKVSGAVCAFLEPIALYPVRDLHTKGDGAWCFPYHPKPLPIGIGEPRVYDGAASDVLIVTYGNGVPMSLRSARKLSAAGIGVRVLDLRWLAPLPHDEVFRHAQEVGRVLVVDETRTTGGVAESVIAGLVDRGFRGAMKRVAAADSFVPLGAAANLVLVQESEIEAAALKLTEA